MASRNAPRRRPTRASGAPEARRPSPRGLGLVVAVALLLSLVGYREIQAGVHRAPDPVAAPASVIDRLSNVPAAALAAGSSAGGSGPQEVRPQPPLLTSNGRVVVTYIGAEYCPYCAVERWALIEALSRFGTFSGLEATESSPLDVYGGTPTFTFLHATYQSPVVEFRSVELQSNQPEGLLGALLGTYGDLQTPDALEQHLLDVYDRPPYATQSGVIPFIDFGNRYVSSGASFSPALFTGLTMTAIAGRLSDPASPIARAVNGEANRFVAAICREDGERPVGTCSASWVRSASTRLSASGGG